MKNLMYKVAAILFAIVVTVAIGFVASVREKKTYNTYNRPYTVNEKVTEEIETERTFEEDIIIENVITYENVETKTWEDFKKFV